MPPFRCLALASALFACSESAGPPAVETIPPEMVFHKASDLGTEVHRMTVDPGEDRTFYQEPHFSSPDGRHFLFKSSRGGTPRLLLLDLQTGAMRVALPSWSFSHHPAWSADGSEILVGQTGRILALDAATLRSRAIPVPGDAWISYLHVNPSGTRVIFIEEGRSGHVALAMIDPRDGSAYRKLYVLDPAIEPFLDHPMFLDDTTVLFHTRGPGRDFRGAFNQPYILALSGTPRRLPRECSHVAVDPSGERILCGQEGYVLDRQGAVLKEMPGLHGHGAWAPDGKRFLMTADPVPVPAGAPWHGKIVLVPWEGEGLQGAVGLVSHESTYDSASDPHEQPNAQFTRDGRFIVYESDLGGSGNPDLFRVGVPP